MRDGLHYLPPRLLQVIGLVLLAGFAGFWAITGRQSELLVGAAMTLILIGAYGSAQQALKDLGRGPTPPPVAPAPEQQRADGAGGGG